MKSVQQSDRDPIWSGFIAAAIALAVTALYAAVIAAQGVGSDDGSRIAFFGTAFASSALLALLGSVHPSPAWRVALLGAASAALFFLGAIGIFSIGAPLLIAAILAVRATIVAARRLPASAPRFAAIGAITALSTLTFSLRVAL